ncbi:hypothetical protein, partial [Neisseria sicca]|uniref:hypothetical protein n=1 Tax=Neisseria sicca TaxID=490 RepID=UPI001C9968E6
DDGIGGCGGDFEREQGDERGKGKMGKDGRGNMVMGECDWGSFDGDFEMVLVVGDGINGVVGKGGERIGGKDEGGGRREGGGEGGK